MTPTPIRQRVTLTPEERDGMCDFLDVLEEHREEAHQAVLQAAKQLPALAPIIEAMDPAEDAARRERSDALQRAALRDGEWEPYLDEMRELGAMYAAQGIPFADWFELIHAYRVSLMPRVLEACREDVVRLKGMVAGMQRFLDVALETLSESYLQEKERKLRRYVRELERSNRELDDFAYVASHDLRSPLRDISNLAGWIVEDVPDDLPPESVRHLELLRSRVGRMERLLDDLLAYSRAGRKQKDSERVDTGALAREVAQLLCTDGRFRVDVADGMPVVRTPRPPLEQVFMNLIGNAIKHHDGAGGHIRIEGRAEDGLARFTVTDDGPGVDPAFHERIFNMFQTLRPRDELEGSGMGLALVKKIVEAHDGEITVGPVGDEGPRGACFSFTWPMEWQPEGAGEMT